jgi:hypothetical protein
MNAAATAQDWTAACNGQLQHYYSTNHEQPWNMTLRSLYVMKSGLLKCSREYSFGDAVQTADQLQATGVMKLPKLFPSLYID